MADRVWGLTRGSRRVHIAKMATPMLSAYSWCGYALSIWWANPSTFKLSEGEEFCHRCIANLNEAQVNPDSPWKDEAIKGIETL